MMGLGGGEGQTAPTYLPECAEGILKFSLGVNYLSMMENSLLMTGH